MGLNRPSTKGWIGELIGNSWIYGLSTLVQRPFIKKSLTLIENRSELMAKTIRSHPTSHILVLEPIFWTTCIFSRFGPKMDLRFLHFPTSLQVTKQPPKENKCAWTISSYYVFVKMSLFILYLPYSFSFVGEQSTFLNYCQILIILCISDSNIGDPILLFQNRTLISKLEP